MSDTYRFCGTLHVLERGYGGSLTSAGHLRVTPRCRCREGCALIQGAASDATKIIAFRCPEGGTTAFDKTFSAISALPRLFPPFPAAHRQRVVLVTTFPLRYVSARTTSPSVSTATRRKRGRKWYGVTPVKTPSVVSCWCRCALRCTVHNSSPLADAG